MDSPTQRCLYMTLLFYRGVQNDRYITTKNDIIIQTTTTKWKLNVKGRQHNNKQKHKIKQQNP